MKYFSTNNRNEKVTFRSAIMNGLASDKGLYLPEYIPTLKRNFIKNLPEMNFHDISYNVAKEFIGKEISSEELHKIIESAISFSAPIIKLSDQLNILELFHGPTLAFKDFGARFMARTMEYFLKNESKEITILVATSGDTGSAVANGFLNVEGINVLVLYPKGKISNIQEKQITTLGNNITALEIEGTFDDCQRIVKEAFVDDDLSSKINLSSANSINIGRLIPQSFYYFESFKQLNHNDHIVYSVPSGNLGNLTAGLFAKQMGLPIFKFIAATNSNNVFTEYINTGIFNPRASVETISNAMDVGNPSNLVRITELFNQNHNAVKDVIFSSTFTDSQTCNQIINIYKSHDYIIDPHGAIGCLALNEYIKTNSDAIGVVLETAHPAKFLDVFKKHLDFQPEIPKSLEQSLEKESHAISLSNNYSEFKSFLIE